MANGGRFMKYMPTISVIMPTYNHEKFIKSAIDGVFIQKTSFTIELIIANDNSPDSSDLVIQQMVNNSPSHILINYLSREINLGANLNLIDAFNAANGKYIAICEGDDYWTDPFKLQKQVDFLEENNDYSAVFSNVNVLLESGTYNKTNEIQPVLESREFTGKEILENWISHTATFVFRNSSGVEKFSRLNKEYQFMYGDTPLLLSLLEYGKLFGLKEYTAVYRRHEGGITNQAQNNSFHISFINHLKAIIKAFDNKIYTNVCNRSITMLYMKLFFNSAFYKPIKYLYLLQAIHHDNKLIFNIIKDKSKKRKYINRV